METETLEDQVSNRAGKNGLVLHPVFNQVLPMDISKSQVWS